MMGKATYGPQVMLNLLIAYSNKNGEENFPSNLTPVISSNQDCFFVSFLSIASILSILLDKFSMTFAVKDLRPLFYIYNLRFPTARCTSLKGYKIIRRFITRFYTNVFTAILPRMQGVKWNACESFAVLSATSC